MYETFWYIESIFGQYAAQINSLLMFIFKVFILFLSFFVLFRLIRFAREFLLKKYKAPKTICVLVLGDIGRSPRMQNHAISAAKEDIMVDLVGYPGTKPRKEIVENQNIQIHYLRPFPKRLTQLPYAVYYISKVTWQTTNLLHVFFSKRIPHTLMIQNPPAIPTIPVCWIYCVLTKTQFVIDWHNYAYSIMALKLGKEHVLVKLAKHIEMTFGRAAQLNLCVTCGMKEDLKEKWTIQAELLRDVVEEEYRVICEEDKSKLRHELAEKYNLYTPDLSRECGYIISSTSWTTDEDFSILLNALQDYENACETENLNLPFLVCVITGKGPMQDFYMGIFKLKNWKHVKVEMVWVEHEDYPKFLASADLGVCLHTSSSGLDFPMKIFDMIYCGLPVCAYKFKCLEELIQHETTGLVFANEEELAQHLKMWFKDFPNNEEQQELRKKLLEKVLANLMPHIFNWQVVWRHLIWRSMQKKVKIRKLKSKK